MIKKLTIVVDDKRIKRYDADRILTAESSFKYIDKDKLREDYINFIGKLNKKYHSVMWWAGSISSKNQYVSQLFKNICFYIEIIETLKHSTNDSIIVGVNNEHLIKQLKKFCKEYKIAYTIKGKSLNGMVQPFFILLTYLLKSGFGILFEWSKKYRAEKKIGKHIIKNLYAKEPQYVIRTWIDSRSFKVDGQFKDIVFGSLLDYIQNKKNMLIVGEILSEFEENLDKIEYNNLHYRTQVVPLSFFIGYLDYLKVFLSQLSVFFDLNKKINVSKNFIFHRHNIYFLIKQEVIKNLSDGEYYTNLLHYSAAKNIGEKLNCEYCTFPYENHSWEKLTILALKKYSPTTFIIGYQHSSISKVLFNYFLSKDEQKINPLPDRIITVGTEPKKIMDKYGNFPSNILYEGCGFRVEHIIGKRILPRKKTRKILVPLSISPDNSHVLLKFLSRALGNNVSFSVLIKCHPEMSIKTLMAKGNFNLPSNFEIVTDKSTRKLLETTADVVLYADTTVCMEALLLGIPVVFIDINKYYNEDRLFGWDVFKWSVKNEKELITSINEIYKMDDIEFARKQILSREYVETYFLPVTEERMKKFVETK